MPHRLQKVALAAYLLLCVAAAGAENSQPLNDNELKAREATAMSGAIEAAAKAQSAVNSAQLPSIGDLSKYKLDAPEAQLSAKTAALAYDEAGHLAQAIAADIEKALASAPQSEPPKPVTLLLAAARTRTLLIQARAVEQGLQAARASLNNITHLLRNDIAATSVPAPTHGGSVEKVAAAAAVALLPAVAAIGETGVAFASALRSSYKFSGTNNTDLVGAAFAQRVLGRLSGKATVLQVDNILNGALDEQSVVLQAHDKLVASTQDARSAVAQALVKAAQMRAGPLPHGPDDSAGGKQRKAILEQADALTAAAVKHNANADAVDKALAALGAPDAQGESPLDQALRGSRLAAELKGSRVYTLSLALASSKADVVAKNGLITGLKLAIGSHSIAGWQLTDADGHIVGTGSVAKATELQQIARDLFSQPGNQTTR